MKLNLPRYLLYHCFDRVRFPRHKVSKLTYTEKSVDAKKTPSYSQLVPFNVWQTWKTIHLPPRIFRLVKRFRQLNQEYSHHLFTDLDCDNFIREFYRGTHVETAYFRLNPIFGAARADFWRYCILYQYGGVYLDIDSTCITPLRSIIRSEDKAVLSHENNSISSWKNSLNKMGFNNFLDIPPANTVIDLDKVLLQWLLIYTPKHRFLERVIEDMSEAIITYREVNNRIRPSGHLRTVSLTGPLRYTNSVWNVLKHSSLIAPDYRLDGIDFSGKAIFQLPGQSDKDRQAKHYTTLSDKIVLDVSES